MIGDIQNSSKIVFITGATGFVGSYLLADLLSQGWEVHILVRKKSSLSEMISLPCENIHVYRNSADSIDRALKRVKPSAVIHLASLFISEHTSKDVTDLIKSNILLGAHLLDAMRVNGIKKLVNTGTAWQHFNGDDYNPVNLYASTKKAFDDILKYYVEAEKFEVITLELSDTYGLNDTRPKLLNLIKKTISTNQPLALSPGFQQIDLIHVSDVCRAYQLALNMLNSPTNSTGTFYVGSKKFVTLRNLVIMIESVIHKKLPVEWGVRAYRKREVMSPWVSDFLPGWRPLVELKNGISEFYE